MGAGVVGLGREADAPRDDCGDPVALGEAFAAEDELLVALEPQRLDELCALSGLLLEDALIGDLTAADRIERRTLELYLEEPVAEIGVGGDRGEHLGLLVADEPR